MGWLVDDSCLIVRARLTSTSLAYLLGILGGCNESILMGLFINQQTWLGDLSWTLWSFHSSTVPMDCKWRHVSMIQWISYPGKITPRISMNIQVWWDETYTNTYIYIYYIYIYTYIYISRKGFGMLEYIICVYSTFMGHVGIYVDIRGYIDRCTPLCKDIWYMYVGYIPGIDGCRWNIDESVKNGLQDCLFRKIRR